jgi:hypothetical protein
MSRKKWILISVLGVAGITLAIALVVVVVPIAGSIIGMFFWASEGENQIRASEALLQKPEMYEPVGKTLALLCQSDQKYMPDILTYPWLPVELSAIGKGHGDVSTNHASVEMGGGFHHFGYQLDRDQRASGAESNIWDLLFYTEYGHKTHLKRFALSVTNRLNSDELLTLVVRGFDREISKTPDDQALRLEPVMHFL